MGRKREEVHLTFIICRPSNSTFYKTTGLNSSEKIFVETLLTKITFFLKLIWCMCNQSWFAPYWQKISQCDCASCNQIRSVFYSEKKWRNTHTPKFWTNDSISLTLYIKYYLLLSRFNSSQRNPDWKIELGVHEKFELIPTVSYNWKPTKLVSNRRLSNAESCAKVWKHLPLFKNVDFIRCYFVWVLPRKALENQENQKVLFSQSRRCWTDPQRENFGKGENLPEQPRPEQKTVNYGWLMPLRSQKNVLFFSTDNIHGVHLHLFSLGTQLFGNLKYFFRKKFFFKRPNKAVQRRTPHEDAEHIEESFCSSCLRPHAETNSFTDHRVAKWKNSFINLETTSQKLKIPYLWCHYITRHPATSGIICALEPC